jgi:hypothetical protein
MMVAPPLVFIKRRFTPFGGFDCFRHDPTLHSKNRRPALSLEKAYKASTSSVCERLPAMPPGSQILERNSY